MLRTIKNKYHRRERSKEKQTDKLPLKTKGKKVDWNMCCKKEKATTRSKTLTAIQNNTKVKLLNL